MLRIETVNAGKKINTYEIKGICIHIIHMHILYYAPVPVAALSKACVCGRSPAEIIGSNPTGGIGVCLL